MEITSVKIVPDEFLELKKEIEEKKEINEESISTARKLVIYMLPFIHATELEPVFEKVVQYYHSFLQRDKKPKRIGNNFHLTKRWISINPEQFEVYFFK